MKPWLGTLLALAALFGLLAALRRLARTEAVHAELVRKGFHVGMGLLTLSFPWLFDAAWPVLLLGALSLVTLLLLRFVSALKESFGCVLGGVARMSLGDLYFPIAIVVLFSLYQREDDPRPDIRLVLYIVPVLLLTLADATAALVGIRYGRFRYVTADGDKSAEGSGAFFTCAFFSVHVPLLLMTDTGRAETLLIALLLAWLAMMFEAIAWAGLDNLILPLVSYLLLRMYLAMPAGMLLERLAVSAALTVFLLMYRTRTTLLGSALFGAFLVGYVSWALGGWQWLLAPLTFFLTYSFFWPRAELSRWRTHNIHAVICVSSASLAWLFLARIFDRPDFLFPSTLAFAVHLAIVGLGRLMYDYPFANARTLLAICIGAGWLLLFGPFVLAAGLSALAVRSALIALPAMAAAVLLFYATQPGMDDCPTDVPRWWRQAADAALASALGFLTLSMF